MRVTFVTLSGDETTHVFEEDATVGQARAKIAALQGVQTSWSALLLGESNLDDDSKLLKEVGAGSDVKLTVCTRRPWSWAEKVNGTVHSLERYKFDSDLSILLKHFNDGNGGECHGRIVVSGKFPGTPTEVLEFLRGEPLSQEEERFDVLEGVECWARDGDDGADWRRARVLCCSHCGDLVQHYTVEWIDGKDRTCGDGYAEVSEVRMLEDRQRGYTTGMTKELLSRRLAKGSGHEKLFSAAFGFVDADDAWNKLPVAPANVALVYRAQLAARLPSARIHDPVVPPSDEEDFHGNAPWWDVLELREVGPEHVAMAAQQRACYVNVPGDHADRAARALRSLVGASPTDSSDVVQEKAASCKFYTHSRTVKDGEGTFYYVIGWDPLVIVANPADATIAFACANGED